LKKPESGTETGVTTRLNGANSRDTVNGTRDLKEVGPTDRTDSQEVARGSAREQLHGKMNFCREAEGTGDPGKSSDKEKGSEDGTHSTSRRMLPG
jgi:hypothetical protein